MFGKILVYHLHECPCYSRLYFDAVSLQKSLLGTLTNIGVSQNKIINVRLPVTIFKHNPEFPIGKANLRELFTFVASQTHFLFNGSFYDQCDGVAMGSPLTPILANLFMGYHEEQWISNYKDSQLLYYRRYVDDTFCLFHNEQDAMKFLSYPNSRHPNIRFTFEAQLNGKLPFLDVLVDNSGASCITSIYHLHWASYKFP